MANVFVEENSLKDIGNAIREKNGETRQYLPREMGDAVRGLSGENPLEMATSLSGIFYSAKLTKDIFIKTGENFKGDLSYFAEYSRGLYKIHIVLTNKVGLIINNFLHASQITEIDFLGKEISIAKGYAIQNAFNLSVNLKKINAILDFSNVTKFVNAFYNCKSLESISIKPNTIMTNISFSDSPLLSSESIQSIIDGLATVTEPQTITFHPDVKSKLTQEQITQITSKNWNLA